MPGRVDELEPLGDPEQLAPAHAVVLAVAHQPYLKEGWGLITSLLDGGKGVVADVKGVLPRDRVPEGVALWRL